MTQDAIGGATGCHSMFFTEAALDPSGFASPPFGGFAKVFALHTVIFAACTQKAIDYFLCFVKIP